MINTLGKYVIPIYDTSLFSVGMAKTFKNINDFIEISTFYSNWPSWVYRMDRVSTYDNMACIARLF